MSCAIEIIRRPNFRLNSGSSGSRCTVPSSFTSSQSTPAGGKPGQRGQVDRRLGVTRALQHAARPGPQRKNMPGLHQLFGPRLRVGEDADRLRAVLGADARRDPLRGVDADGEIRAVRLAVLAHHRPESEALELGLDAGHANDAAAVADHHAHRLGRDLGGRHDQIALVLAVLVVRHDHQPAGGDLLEGGFDCIKWRI